MKGEIERILRSFFVDGGIEESSGKEVWDRMDAVLDSRDFQKSVARMIAFIQQEKDKSFQAGFQEAVEKITEAVEKAGDLSMLGSASGSAMKSSMLIFLDTLKPTQSQGSEGEKK